MSWIMYPSPPPLPPPLPSNLARSRSDRELSVLTLYKYVTEYNRNVEWRSQAIEPHSMLGI